MFHSHLTPAPSLCIVFLFVLLLWSKCGRRTEQHLFRRCLGVPVCFCLPEAVKAPFLGEKQWGDCWGHAHTDDHMGWSLGACTHRRPHPRRHGNHGETSQLGIHLTLVMSEWRSSGSTLHWPAHSQIKAGTINSAKHREQMQERVWFYGAGDRWDLSMDL